MTSTCKLVLERTRTFLEDNNTELQRRISDISKGFFTVMPRLHQSCSSGILVSRDTCIRLYVSDVNAAKFVTSCTVAVTEFIDHVITHNELSAECENLNSFRGLVVQDKDKDL